MTLATCVRIAVRHSSMYNEHMERNSTGRVLPHCGSRKAIRCRSLAAAISTHATMQCSKKNVQSLVAARFIVKADGQELIAVAKRQRFLSQAALADMREQWARMNRALAIAAYSCSLTLSRPRAFSCADTGPHESRRDLRAISSRATSSDVRRARIGHHS